MWFEAHVGKDANGAPGSGVTASQLSYNRPSLFSQFAVESEEKPALRAIDSRLVERTALVRMHDDLEACESVFGETCKVHNCSQLMIRPASGVQWVGAAKLRHGRDLQIYAQVNVEIDFDSHRDRNGVLCLSLVRHVGIEETESED